MENKFKVINDKYFDFSIFDEIINEINNNDFYDSTMKVGIEHAVNKVKQVRESHYDAIKKSLEGTE